MLQNTPPPLRPPDRLPILYSAFVYPGAGQFLQKRPFAGWAYAVCATVFLVLFAAVLAQYFREVVAAVRAMLEGTYAPAQDEPHVRQLLMPGALLLAIHLANVFDVWVSYLKQKRMWDAPA